jgi:hypothetical protein
MSARAHGYAHREIVCGASRNAIYLARVAPTSMISIPCKDGISYNELEDAWPERVEAGANVLLHAVLSRAGAGSNPKRRHGRSRGTIPSPRPPRAGRPLASEEPWPVSSASFA